MAQATSKQTSLPKTAWVAGASGLIGRSLVEQLCNSEDYGQVVAFVRPSAKQTTTHPKLSYFVCDWAQLIEDETFQAPTVTVDALYCALGSTTKKTPDKNAYRRIDIDYPVAFAKLGLKHNARFYGVVSAHGADGRLPSFYLGMKKDMEAQLIALAYDSLSIARPSLLLGEREEFRLGERASEWVCKHLPGNYKAIEGHDVAAALIRSEQHSIEGCTILESATMQRAYQK